MKTVTLITAGIIFGFFTLQAQNYNTGIGFRLGSFYRGGITVKHFPKVNEAIEGILSGSQEVGASKITGLYEYHHPISDKEEFKWYIGFGGHIGFGTPGGDDAFVLGPDGTIGIAYTFLDVPINLALDYTPNINIIPNLEPGFQYGALSFRYTFK